MSFTNIAMIVVCVLALFVLPTTTMAAPPTKDWNINWLIRMTALPGVQEDELGLALIDLWNVQCSACSYDPGSLSIEPTTYGLQWTAEVSTRWEPMDYETYIGWLYYGIEDVSQVGMRWVPENGDFIIPLDRSVNVPWGRDACIPMDKIAWKGVTP